MQYRTLGKTGFKISEISLGTWQVGGKWGEPFNEQTAEQIVGRAIDQGINFFDTADVYSDGLSERAVAKVVRSHQQQELYIATKCGRQINPHVSEGYTPQVLQGFVEASLKNMQLECIDLIQLHCPPTEVYYRPEIFGLFDKLKTQGKIRFLGVSVEKVEEALKAIEYPNVATVQIIFNMFRHRPAGLFFKQAAKRNIGIIVRVPLASGLLSGKMTAQTSFGKDDHRQFNRNGEAFDKGETFSGVDFDTGLKAVEELKSLFPENASLAQWALRWILMFPEVSCVIPGASRPEQMEQNIKAADLPPLTQEQMTDVKRIYDEYIRNPVHHLW
ncbi:MAG: aldo/keto reductase [Spirochaetales bacterium]|nr:aldo/keto reductase [Spirochaetales bacterium]